MTQTHHRKDAKIVVLSFLIVLALAVSAFLVFYFPREKSGFCTVTDPVYVEFKSRIDDFRSFFPSIASPLSVVAKPFDVPSKGSYIVRADYSSEGMSLYVPVLEAFSHSITGVEGYLYSPQLSDFWKDNYELTVLSENFYCYKN